MTLMNVSNANIEHWRVSDSNIEHARTNVYDPNIEHWHVSDPNIEHWWMFLLQILFMYNTWYLVDVVDLCAGVVPVQLLFGFIWWSRWVVVQRQQQDFCGVVLAQFCLLCNDCFSNVRVMQRILMTSDMNAFHEHTHSVTHIPTWVTNQ